MTINTRPVYSNKRLRSNNTVQDMIRYEKEQLLYELQTLIILAGGVEKSIEELECWSIGELVDALYTNNIEFEIRPILKIGTTQDEMQRWEFFREATYRAQNARERAVATHAQVRQEE
jgi:hypothetical protein